MQIITTKEAIEFTAPFIGKVLNRVWQGNGSALFLEFGELTNNKGELTVMIEWSWRVENEQEIEFGSWSEESKVSERLQNLNGLTLKGVLFQSRLPEVVLELSRNKWVCSFSTVEGDPEWALITPSKTMLSSKGNLGFELSKFRIL